MKAQSLIETTVQMFGDIREIIADNKRKLVRGSVLDPFGHPSFTEEQSEKYKNNQAAYDLALAKLKTKHNM
jgi:hypothetical protein